MKYARNAARLQARANEDRAKDRRKGAPHDLRQRGYKVVKLPKQAMMVDCRRSQKSGSSVLPLSWELKFQATMEKADEPNTATGTMADRIDWSRICEIKVLARQ